MKSGRPYPKDWERKLRITTILNTHRIGVTELARRLGVSQPHVTEVIWGVRKSPIMEERIAAYFGMTRAELFPKTKRVAKSEGGVAA